MLKVFIKFDSKLKKNFLILTYFFYRKKNQNTVCANYLFSILPDPNFDKKAIIFHFSEIDFIDLKVLKKK